ncbi:MAG TPA: cytochrome P460 family protein [Burkholderiales bacterium]
MKTRICLLSLAIASTGALAGPEKIKYPADYLKGVLYQTLDRPDVKQYRELYTQAAVVDAVRKGKPIPSGAVLTLVQWNVYEGANGKPLLGPDGRFIKKEVVGHTVMEKQTGWGAEYPASKRNGEWEYQAFDAQGLPNPKANIDGCFQCHLPHAKQDFVMSLAKLDNTFPKAGQAKAAKGDVTVASFQFMPATISASAGYALTFLNTDDTPHQISVANGPRSPVFLRGQKASVTLDKAGDYAYVCGLHPSMKGVISVK